MGRLGLGLGLGLVLVLRQGLGLALGLQLRIGIGFRRNHSWSSTFTPRRNHSLCLKKIKTLCVKIGWDGSRSVPGKSQNITKTPDSTDPVIAKFDLRERGALFDVISCS